MSPPLAVSQRSGPGDESRLPAARTGFLQTLLRSELESQAITLARCAGAIADDAAADATGLGRARVALDMYRACETIEEIESALARMEAGGYGICSVCALPIPFEHLEAIPQARYCAACPAPAIPSPGCRAGPRLGPRSPHDPAGRLPHHVLSRQGLTEPTPRRSENADGKPTGR